MKIAGRVSETDRHLRMYARCFSNARKNLMIFLSKNAKDTCRGGLGAIVYCILE